MNRKGLTLIEIMIAVLIILIAAAGILGAFIGGHQLMNYSRHKLQAMNFAREALDKLRCDYEYDSSAMLAGNHDYTTDPAICASGNIIRGEMQGLNSAALTYSVSAEPETDSYKEVTVSVQWTEAAF
ncbi:MAG: type II secretion system protein [Candidatus Omnitrophica bacterium]|nr:type II secretion system protein [Candidatus Omnitrophota bacterium]